MLRPLLLLAAGASIVLVAAATRSPAADSEAPRTLLVIPGTIAAFAHDADVIAWAGTVAAGARGECRRTVRLHHLRNGRVTILARRDRRHTCGRAPFQPRMALTGGRVAWGRVVGGEGGPWTVTLYAASPRRARAARLGTIRESEDDAEGFPLPLRPVPLLGARGLLFFAITEFWSDGALTQEPIGVFRVDVGTRVRVRHLPQTERTVAVAVEGRRLVLARRQPTGPTIEVRDVPTGATLSSFPVSTLPDEVALGGGRVLLLRRAACCSVEIRTMTGQVVAIARHAARVPIAGLRAHGRWAVFHDASDIHVIDTSTGRLQLLARAAGEPIGLSIRGRDVVWAEAGRRRSHVRAAALPP